MHVVSLCIWVVGWVHGKHIGGGGRGRASWVGERVSM
jgi:hypothetical protein